ncbi:MAG TPA: ester cyclase [Longimicrobium sp.]|jgi:steroid delta-isomerase-like uncharacterized protein
MATESETVIRRWFAEVWNERRLDRVEELWASNGVAHGLAEGGADDIHGPEEWRRFIETMLQEFAEFQITVEDVIADGEKVAARWVAEGTYHGTMLAPTPPQPQRVRMTGMTIARVVDGQIVEGWNNWDIMGMMGQLGAPPAMANLLT